MSLFIRSSKLTPAALRSSLRIVNSHAATSANHHFVRTFTNTATKMGVHEINSKKEFDTAIKDNKVVVLDAYATWCGPCKVIAPTVAKFSEDHTGAHFVKVDVDEVPDVAQELGIRAMPTFLVFKHGEKVSEVVGANPKALEHAIKNATSA